MTTHDRVKSILVSTLGIENQADGIDESTRLFGSLPELDSMSVVELVVALEEHLGVEIHDEELTEETFETVGSLADLMERKLASGSTG